MDFHLDATRNDAPGLASVNDARFLRRMDSLTHVICVKSRNISFVCALILECRVAHLQSSGSSVGGIFVF